MLSSLILGISHKQNNQEGNFYTLVCGIFSPYPESYHEWRQSVPPSKVPFIFQRKHTAYKCFLCSASKSRKAKNSLKKKEQILNRIAQATVLSSCAALFQIQVNSFSKRSCHNLLLSSQDWCRQPS